MRKITVALIAETIAPNTVDGRVAPFSTRLNLMAACETCAGCALPLWARGSKPRRLVYPDNSSVGQSHAARGIETFA